ncbi:MAG: ferritin family protein [Candidatus Aminicenantes bacterium]|nr:ferritin family protein [Candidatus Aminicenantes bacterium]
MSEKTKTTFVFKNIDEILDFAIKSEEAAHLFYVGWAKKLEKSHVSKFFAELAAEELKHKKFIIGLKEGKTLQPPAGQVADLKISDYLVDIEASQALDFQDALTVAMHREKEAFKLYNKLAAMTADQGVKDTFLVLAQEEAKHKLRLETIYDEEILKEN